MRQLITGIDADGRSCVVTEHVIEPKTGDKSRNIDSFITTENPAPPRPPSNGEFVDLGVPVGTMRMMLTQWTSDFSYGMHHTDTIDFDAVLEGSCTLILEDGPHMLEPGNIAVIMGVDHAWEAGPEGTTIRFIFLGTPPPGD